MSTPPILPPPTAAEEYAAAGITPERLAAFQRLQQAQTPAEYAAAAEAAGLTNQAWQAAAGQVAAGVAPGPVAAPSFDEQVAEYKQRAAAAEAQVGSLNQQYTQAIKALQDQVAQLMGSIPQRVDPVSESAAKVARALADVPNSDARNILRSALHSHLTNLGLTELAKLV